VAATLFGMNFRSQAADKPPANTTKSAPAKAAITKGRPFRGKIKTVNQAAPSTIVLEGPKAQTFLITPDTRISKDNQPATLQDLKPGEAVTGYARETPEGKWEARTVYAGQRAPKTK